MAKKSKSSSKSRRLSLKNTKENVETLKKNILSVSKNMSGTDIRGAIDTVSNRVFIVVYVIISVIIIGLNLAGLFWIDKLEKTDCKCSVHWKRDYIKYYLYCLLTMQFVMFVLTIIYGMQARAVMNDTFGSLYKLITFILAIANVINVVVVITYVNELRKIKCSCSEDIKRDVYYTYNLIEAFMYIIMILIFIMMLVLGFFSLFR
jgi:hypothetical protein